MRGLCLSPGVGEKGRLEIRPMARSHQVERVDTHAKRCIRYPHRRSKVLRVQARLKDEEKRGLANDYLRCQKQRELSLCAWKLAIVDVPHPVLITGETKKEVGLVVTIGQTQGRILDVVTR